MRRLLIVFGLLAALPASASAASWSAPQNISQSANDLSGGSIAVDRQGRALVSWPAWRWVSGEPRGRYELESWFTATRAPHAPAFDLPRRAPSFAAGPVLYGTSRAVGLERHAMGWLRCGELGTLRATFGRSTGLFERPTTIATFTGAGGGDGAAVVAANDAGRVLLAWGAATTSDCRTSAVRIALRQPGGAGFGRPETLRGSGRPERPSAAVGASGDMLVAWARRLGGGRTNIEARVRPAGRRWGPVETLGQGSVAGSLTTAVARNGRAYVAWADSGISESGSGATLHVAVRPAGGFRFRKAVLLERVRTPVAFLPRLGPDIALAGTNALIAWTGWDGTVWRVRVAASNAAGAFGPPQTVSAPGAGASLGDLSALPDGTATVVWSRLDQENLPRNAQASFRPAGGPFGSPEIVSVDALRLPAVALDPTTSRPTAVWPQRMGASTSVSSITAYMRAAIRAPGG